MSNSKIAIKVVGGSEFLLYKDKSNKLQTLIDNGTTSVIGPYLGNITDIGSEITPTSNLGKIFYISSSSSSKLKYVSGGISRSTSVNNCTGWLTMDENDNLYYIGLGDVWHFNPNQNVAIRLTHNVSTNYFASKALTVSKDGNVMYYVDISNNLCRIHKNNAGSWTAPQRITNGSTQSGQIVIDPNNNNRVFYSTYDNWMGSCYFYGNRWYDFILSWDARQNVATDCNIAISPDSGMIFYKGLDKKLWYYFTDGGWNTGTGKWYNCNANVTGVFRFLYPNGVPSITTNDSSVDGPIIVRTDDGRVIYRSINDRLWQLTMKKVGTRPFICRNSSNPITLY